MIAIFAPRCWYRTATVDIHGTKRILTIVNLYNWTEVISDPRSAVPESTASD
jgi:hypothetical protein